MLIEGRGYNSLGIQRSQVLEQLKKVDNINIALSLDGGFSANSYFYDKSKKAEEFVNTLHKCSNNNSEKYIQDYYIKLSESEQRKNDKLLKEIFADIPDRIKYKRKVKDGKNPLFKEELVRHK